ncbi:hypothetical protein Hypma_001346 [Hypsizygus marmoreus]|uniref:Uncharacterized protein n=1 Tax=Hypsizygus marmoreus TaxID=39966 RepID=A0A369K4B9_HYPMA|nr:hypothetical protein Hypma_001346 [Hypsizygus marmoreus]
MPRTSKTEQYVFTNEQMEAIDNFFPELKGLVEKHDPMFKGHCAEVNQWKKDTAEAIMKGALFKDMPPCHSRDQWEKAIRRRFGNYIHNRLKKQAVTMQSKSNKTSERDVDIASKKVLQRAFLIFTGDYPACQLFANDNESAIQVAAKAISNGRPSYAGGAAYQMALADLWSKADQELWEAKAKALAEDISVNQEEFPALMSKALRELCGRGALGSTIMALLYAYRCDDNGLEYGTIYTGYDGVTKSEIQEELGDHEAVTEMWYKHAQRLIPCMSPKSSITIPHSCDGVPIFPDVDVMTCGISMAVEVIKDYFTTLWGEASTIPWARIVETPTSFYDTDTFQLPAPLQNPTLLNAVEVCLLVDFFTTQTKKGAPFQFRLVNDLSSSAATTSTTRNSVPSTPTPPLTNDRLDNTSGTSKPPSTAHLPPKSVTPANSAAPPTTLGVLPIASAPITPIPDSASLIPFSTSLDARDPMITSANTGHVLARFSTPESNISATLQSMPSPLTPQPLVPPEPIQTSQSSDAEGAKGEMARVSAGGRGHRGRGRGGRGHGKVAVQQSHEAESSELGTQTDVRRSSRKCKEPDSSEITRSTPPSKRNCALSRIIYNNTVVNLSGSVEW